MTPAETTYYETLAGHVAGTIDPSKAAPRIGFNWVPITQFFGHETSWQTAVPTLFDFDGDGDVDSSDFASFSACVNGVGQRPRSDRCGLADADRDGDVDETDFWRFQGCFNGSEQPSNCLPRMAVTPMKDLDLDGDVDGADFSIIAGCFNGTGNRVATSCLQADLDGDNSVDAQDLAILASCFNGTGNPQTCR
jgi:hypothetical protein